MKSTEVEILLQKLHPFSFLVVFEDAGFPEKQQDGV
jgi:hypothetical protein